MKPILTASLVFLSWLTLPALVAAQKGPKVLVVSAHPDDETSYAATIYKITHDLGGIVDEAVITNGEAGFKYSTLAESIYGAELTDERVGRSLLPTIRKKELMSGGEIMGIRNYYFFDQVDNAYTLNVDSVLTYVWDVDAIQHRLRSIITDEKYDYVFCLLPEPGTHGHHKGATILVLRVLLGLPSDQRPIILAGSTSSRTDSTVLVFTGLDGYPETQISDGKPRFRFDRTVKFGFKDRLDYHVIVNWVIAEHKSQGAMQLSMNRGDFENLWWFDMNDSRKSGAVAQLFDQLARIRFKPRTY